MNPFLSEQHTAPEIAKCVLYARVSSKKQVKEGSGIKSQLTRCRDHAKSKNYSVEDFFIDEGVSGGDLEREGMRDLLAFLREHATPENPYAVVFDDISRFARDTRVHDDLREAVIAAGGVLECPSVQFREDADSRTVEKVQAVFAEHQRKKNAETTRNRLAARWKDGYYTANPPVGYKYTLIKGRGKMLVPDEPLASYVREAFEGLACGRFASATEVKRYLETKPDFPRNTIGEVRLQTVIDMVRRDTYAGFLSVKSRGIHMQPAQHEPLIDAATWEKANRRLDGVSLAPAKANISQDFPLRGFVTCGCCGGVLTAGWNKGRNKRYPNYMCHNRGCAMKGKSINREKIEGEFLELVRRLRPAPNLFELAKDMFKRFWDARIGDAEHRRDALGREVADIERKIESLTERLLATDVPSVIAAYENQIGKLETKKAVMRQRCGRVFEPQKPFEEMFKQAWGFFSNPCNLWENGSYAHKRLLLRMAFTDKLAYSRDDGFIDCLNRKIAVPFGVYGDLEKNSGMVRTGGLEPPRGRPRQILSLLRLPVPPRPRRSEAPM